jgi:hypothetical protein
MTHSDRPLPDDDVPGSDDPEAMNRDEYQEGDPPQARDTVRIRPLKPWASRLFVTAALIAAAGLSYLAARMMTDMASDPNIQARYEAIERMKAGSDSLSMPADGGAPQAPVIPADSTSADSTRKPANQ